MFEPGQERASDIDNIFEAIPKPRVGLMRKLRRTKKNPEYIDCLLGKVQSKRIHVCGVLMFVCDKRVVTDLDLGHPCNIDVVLELKHINKLPCRTHIYS